MSDAEEGGPPLAGRYWPVVAVAVLALAPYILLTTAAPLLTQAIAKSGHLSQLQGQFAEGLSNAGYAFGAVLASWLVQRFRQRRLFLLTEAAFVAGSVLAATAGSPAAFMTGRILQGTTTGLMLVIALPPLVTRFPAARMGSTAAAVNLGLFGAVCAGPVAGGVVATGDRWRVLYGAVALLGVAGLGLAAASLERGEPFDAGRPSDVPAFALALGATALPFFGSRTW